MTDPLWESFPFRAGDPSLGDATLLPYAPITLHLGQQSVSVLGLLDTGATVNVLPFHIGRELHAVWEDQTTVVRLTGNLAREEARVLVVSGTLGRLAPVRLAFAWTRSDSLPVLLGQVNFFMEFDVSFFRSRAFFEVRRA